MDMKEYEAIARQELYPRLNTILSTDRPKFLRNTTNAWVESAWTDGFEQGFKKSRDMIKAELYNIAAQTDDSKIFTIIQHVMNMGEQDLPTEPS
jgi:hypothetical protein